MTDPYQSTSGPEGIENVAPPQGPPPPQVPSGWVARWDPRYNTFFYVDLLTKKSQWEKPPGTIDSNVGIGPSTPNPERARESTSSRPPPYESTVSSSSIPRTTDPKPSQQSYSSLIPSSVHQQYPPHQQSTSAPSTPSPSQAKTRSGGLSSKISKFLSSHSHPHSPYPNTPGFYHAQPQPYYGTNQYRPMLYGQPHMMYTGMQPHRRRGGGIGPGGAAAMGLGGGLLGGMLLADAMDNDYAEGFSDGADFGGDFGGGDFGGGDFGGGDFGGF